MHVIDRFDRDTEALGPGFTDRLGEVWVLNGRLISVIDLWAQYRPGLERRIRGERRQGERRTYRAKAARRQVCRRIRDAVNRDAWRVICENMPRQRMGR